MSASDNWPVILCSVSTAVAQTYRCRNLAFLFFFFEFESLRGLAEVVPVPSQTGNVLSMRPKDANLNANHHSAVNFAKDDHI